MRNYLVNILLIAVVYSFSFSTASADKIIPNLENLSKIDRAGAAKSLKQTSFSAALVSTISVCKNRYRKANAFNQYLNKSGYLKVGASKNNLMQVLMRRDGKNSIVLLNIKDTVVGCGIVYGQKTNSNRKIKLALQKHYSPSLKLHRANRRIGLQTWVDKGKADRDLVGVTKQGRFRGVWLIKKEHEKELFKLLRDF
ncbi:hypothetical protein [Amylibacter sp. IMCC11727]|uniref:hypothetical protein n=1 Tax=Amylibacter sp. IMCC11727 TaxID=3039851 RepID=UPI00244DFE4D|nr:hypothetical protein [Amylibacter sp. IMCC11727]WGI21361.1 hypothetical protein QBD29_14760 [Amylibacter sp. IMCC11727]